MQLTEHQMRSHSAGKMNWRDTWTGNSFCRIFTWSNGIERDIYVFMISFSRQHAPKFFQNHRKQIHAPTIKMVEMAFWQFARTVVVPVWRTQIRMRAFECDYDFGRCLRV